MTAVSMCGSSASSLRGRLFVAGRLGETHLSQVGLGEVHIGLGGVPAGAQFFQHGFHFAVGQRGAVAEEFVEPCGFEHPHIRPGGEAVVRLILQRSGFQTEDVQCSWHKRSDGSERVACLPAAKRLNFMTRLVGCANADRFRRNCFEVRLLGFHARRFREAQLAFRQRFIKEVFDFGLFTVLGHRQFDDQQVTGAFQHFLFPETEWLALSEEKEAFQDYGNVEEGTGPHLVRIFLEPVFPVGVVLAFAIGEEIYDLLHLAIANYFSEADAANVVERHHHLQAAGFDFEKVEPLDLGADRSTVDLLDYAYPVGGINDFVSDAKGQAMHEGRTTAPRAPSGILWGRTTTYIMLELYPHSPQRVNGRGFRRIRARAHTAANKLRETAPRVDPADRAVRARIISRCLRVASSRPKASTQKYAGTHPKEDRRGDRGPRTRTESRAAERAEEGCCHG